MKRQYKFVLKPLSFYSDVYSADTIFGTVCWYIRYLYGEDTLISLLNEFNDDVPFIISSFIPEGYIPKPLLPFQLKDSVKEIEIDKQFKSVKWIPIELFKKYQANYNQDAISKELNVGMSKTFNPDRIDITRNSINRMTGMVREGMLFTESYYYEDISYNVYVTEFNSKYSDIFKKSFSVACSVGFGGDPSTGKGLFDVKLQELNEVEKNIFDYQSNYFVTLSECAGSNLDPLCYTTMTKYGKLGGEFSQKGINGRLLFNKKPIVLYEIGSSFKKSDNGFGVMLKNIHTDTRIVQYAFAYPVFFDYSGDMAITT
ncbi:MAG: hypothetical protein WHV26_08630 [Spirochaetota bacterium]